ncbi:MAG: hypothetical protein IJT63_00300 [Lachnospiraceae bacterium]|nr:hypothetical protein [Lachnospiraceae bacterium]
MIDINNTKAEILEEFKRLLDLADKEGIDIPEKALGCSNRSNKADLLSAVKLLEKSFKNGKDTHSPGEQMSLEDISYGEGKSETAENITKEQKQTRNEKTRIAEEDELKLLNQDIVEKIQSLEKARAFREQEYRDLLQFEEELEKTVSMFNEFNERFSLEERVREEKLKNEKDKSNEEIGKLELELKEKRIVAEEKLEELKRSFSDKENERDNLRSTEQEAFLYEQRILRKKEDDAWEDEKNKRTAAVESIEDEIKKLEEELSLKESLIPELKEKLDKLPEQLDKARAEGAREREEELNREFAHRASIVKMDAEAEIKSYERKIESLREDYDAMKADRAVIQEKLDKAYEESNKLYLQTIQSTGGVKILSNVEKK